MSDHDFLATGGNETKEAKWNMFRFQDHLLSWISVSAQFFQDRDYPCAFEALTNVFTDIYGFFNEKEKEEMDNLFADVLKNNSSYTGYNLSYIERRKRIRNQTYQPPMEIYHSLLKFRKRLMELMTKYQLLIPQVKKGEAGAGSQ